MRVSGSARSELATTSLISVVKKRALTSQEGCGWSSRRPHGSRQTGVIGASPEDRAATSRLAEPGATKPGALSCLGRWLPGAWVVAD